VAEDITSSEFPQDSHRGDPFHFPKASHLGMRGQVGPRGLSLD
jgi:hypothetical protein